MVRARKAVLLACSTVGPGSGRLPLLAYVAVRK